MTLGITILVAFGMALAVRPVLMRRFVHAAPIEDQPRRQFTLEMLSCLAAGCAVGLFNKLVHDFYLISALSLLSGCLFIGFFMGLDMALARERGAIYRALEINASMRPPRRYYPLTRKFSLVAFTTILLICVTLAMVIARDFAWLADQSDPAALKTAERTVMLEVFFIMAVLLGIVVNLIFSYSRNLKLLFNNETRVLEKVSRGDLTQMVPVATRDEFGVIAGHTNDMIRGLRHRTELIDALQLADEVQHNLLPRGAFSHPAAEVAGTSQYCTDTGGDYYDHFELPGGRMGVVVADSSGHGVSSAIHMTSTRAYLRAGLTAYSGPEALVRQTNHFLVRDSHQTGWFITLFLLEIDPRAKRLTWIRAGHEPGWRYDPQSDRFRKLEGEGVALGAVTDPSITTYTHQGWNAGTIIFLATDGIRETRNDEGVMFGPEGIQSVLRAHAHQPAEHILTALVEALENFRGHRAPEDDITMVILKLK
ncbi:MAG: SpoIIE family protein phosphatase [Desulfobacterales bacterium]|nr:SpoIIE family protein phosphatase [Desulfobacterales bacterium]MDJ0875136.1 SpoIIE family protein phosphatase [Desulfobacterales bacterium]